jgi:gmma-aminobutyric acid receptor subunit gamma
MVHAHRQCLRRLTKMWLFVTKTLINFYRCTIESILSGCITAWYGNCTAHNRRAVQRVVWYAQSTTGGKLLDLQITYNTRCHRMDNNHPKHCLFILLPSRRYIKLGQRD